MSSMDQSAIDALLSKIEQQSSDVSAQAGAAPVSPADAAAAATAATTVQEILGDMEPPPGRRPAPAADLAGATADPGLVGDFDAPLPAQPEDSTGDVARLLAIEVPIIVQLGRRRMTVGEVMRLGVGAIVEFNKAADEELDLLANNKPIGRGHAVKVGENFGIRITTVGSVRETIRKLGTP